MSDGLYYTTNFGVNWTQSNFTIGGTTSGNFFTVALSGTNAIAATSTDNNGIYYSINSGETWTQSINLTTGNFNSVALSSDGTKGIAGSNSALGLYYTTNSGVTWTRSDLASGDPTENDFYSVSLSGTNAIAGSMSGTGIYYSTNSGQTWTQSPINLGNFTSVALSSDGINGIAGTDSNLGLYYTNNSGTTWTQSSTNSGNFYSVALSSDGINGIAGSASELGIYYTLTPICYEENVEILCYENEIEIYKKINNIKVNDQIKTYKDGYKKVTQIKSFIYKKSNFDEIKNLYKLKNTDIILTGGHSILVDELAEEESKKNIKYGFSANIHDKKLLLACGSDKFEKISDDKDYILYHLVLENDNINGHYGVYLRHDILSESCSEACFQSFF